MFTEIYSNISKADKPVAGWVHIIVSGISVATTVFVIPVFVALAQSHSVAIFSAAFVSATLSWWISKALFRHITEIKLKQERQDAHNAAMDAATHYIGNSLNTFLLIELEFESTGSVGHDTLRMIKTELYRAKDSLRAISLMENPTNARIRGFIEKGHEVVGGA